MTPVSGHMMDVMSQRQPQQMPPQHHHPPPHHHHHHHQLPAAPLPYQPRSPRCRSRCSHPSPVCPSMHSSRVGSVVVVVVVVVAGAAVGGVAGGGRRSTTPTSGGRNAGLSPGGSPALACPASHRGAVQHNSISTSSSSSCSSSSSTATAGGGGGDPGRDHHPSR
ncbi:hypothetical protein CRUP_022729 [Coryphaenoides rupestris]|nr:hypothetical protein CRUP_022729 [Coryphaenoides rupestris]